MTTPRTLNTIVSELDTAHAARLRADKFAKELATTEARLKQELINFMVEQDVKSIGSESYMFSVKEKTRVNVTDWQQIYEYIERTGEWDLMYKRLNESAALARSENGQLLPGTEQYIFPELSIRARN